MTTERETPTPRKRGPRPAKIPPGLSRKVRQLRAAMAAMVIAERQLAAARARRNRHLRELIEAGAPQTAVARIVGISPARVHMIRTDRPTTRAGRRAKEGERAA